MGRAPAVALVRSHHAPREQGEMFRFGSMTFKAEKGGTQLHFPPEPPSSTSKGHLGISAGNPLFSWENVKV